MTPIMSVPKRNKSLYVTISTTPLIQRVKRYPLKKRANRPPFKVRLIPTILYHYIHIFASIISTVKFNEIFLIMGGGFLGPFQTMDIDSAKKALHEP